MTGEPISELELDRAVAVLRDAVGFRFDSAARTRLERCVRDAAERQQRTVSSLVGVLGHDAAALDALLEEVTVQETQFFRHPKQFEALAEHLLPELRGERVTVWSAGCANGQEPYTLAMLFAETGIDASIIATDVSGRALRRTADGSYEERELRGLDAARRARHGTTVGDRWVVSDALRERVSPVRHRLAHDAPPVGPGQCRLVLCRNVLIYLDAPDTTRFLRRAASVLAPGGWLLLGGSEALHQVDADLELVRFGDVFAYRRPAAIAAPAPPAPVAPRPPAVVVPPLEELPDAGRVLEQGEIAIEAGDLPTAIRLFRQAAYLDPERPLAHVLLGVALERGGDAAGARRAYSAAWEALAGADPAALTDELDGHPAAALVQMVAAKLRQVAA